MTSIEQTCRSPVPSFLDSLYEQVFNQMHELRAQASRAALFDDEGLDVAEKDLHDIVLITKEIVNSPRWPWYINCEHVKDKVIATVHKHSYLLIGGSIQTAKELKYALRITGTATSLPQSEQVLSQNSTLFQILVRQYTNKREYMSTMDEMEKKKTAQMKKTYNITVV